MTERIVAREILEACAGMRKQGALEDKSLCWPADELERLAMFAIDAKNRLAFQPVDEERGPRPSDDMMRSRFQRAVNTLLGAHGDWARYRYGQSEAEQERMATVAKYAESEVTRLYDEALGAASRDEPRPQSEGLKWALQYADADMAFCEDLAQRLPDGQLLGGASEDRAHLRAMRDRIAAFAYVAAGRDEEPQRIDRENALIDHPTGKADARTFVQAAEPSAGPWLLDAPSDHEPPNLFWKVIQHRRGRAPLEMLLREAGHPLGEAEAIAVRDALNRVAAGSTALPQETKT